MDIYGIVRLPFSAYIGNSLAHCLGYHIWLLFGLTCGDADTKPGGKKDPYFTPKKSLQISPSFLVFSSYYYPQFLHLHVSLVPPSPSPWPWQLLSYCKTPLRR